MPHSAPPSRYDRDDDVDGNQTVGAGTALTVASAAGFNMAGSIVVNSVSYAYSSITATTLVLRPDGAFTNGRAVTQAGISVKDGDQLDF